MAGPARADTFHVGPRGDDTGPGTEVAPWATVQHAAEQVVAGDRVVVHAGTYRGFELRHRGKPDAPIAIVADPGVTLTGDNPSTPDGIALAGVAYVELAGFAIAAPSRDGVRVFHSTAITLRRIQVTGAGVTGIEVDTSDDVTIDGATVSGTQRSHGIAITGGARPRIAGAQVSDSARDGIAVIGADAAVVIANRVWSSGAAGISLDSAPHATIASCVLWGNAAAGISLHREPRARIANNTIVAPAGAWAIRLREGSTNATVKNNILESADPATGAIDLNPTCLPIDSDHNAVTPRFTFDGTTVVDLPRWQQQGRGDVASFAAPDDLFVDPATGNFALRPDSPALDRGDDASAPDRDAAGNRRIAGKHVDLGAYELCGARCEPAAERSPATLAPRSGCCDGGSGAGLAPLVALLAVRRRRRYGDRASTIM